MKASEHARRFAEQDAREQRAPFAILHEALFWSALLAVGAVANAVLAASESPELWWPAAGCALGSLLLWLLARAAR